MNDNLNLIEADQKAKAYSGLSRYYASGNDGWLSVHAQIESDLALTKYVLETYNVDVNPVLEEIALIISETSFPSDSASAIVEHIRSAISSVLSEELVSVWREHLTNTEMFTKLEEVSSENALAMAASRMNNQNVEDFVSQRYSEAKEKMENAHEFLANGQEWDAIVSAYSADLASFEGWLFQRSADLGDFSFTQAEMMWSLGMAALEDIEELPSNFNEAVSLVRSRLSWVAGLNESKELAKAFEIV